MPAFPTRRLISRPHDRHILRTLASLDDALLRDIGVERPRPRRQVPLRMLLG